MAKRNRPKSISATFIGTNKFEDRPVVAPFDYVMAVDRQHHRSEFGYPHEQQLVQDIWEDKYRWDTEQTPSQTFARVATAISPNDPRFATECFNAMQARLWMPGGRIIAGAGTDKRVTLMNCYVNRELEDSLDNIMQGVSDAALTQQQGGGIGTDFSTLRPTGAILHRTGATASGPLPFMDMWHSMCSTIMSAGDRRGAMMGTLSDTHPDLPKFIVANHVKDRLTNFNVSVLVSDAFMEAVREDEDWVLHFNVEPRHREPDIQEYDFFDDDGVVQYAYSVWKAKDLWNLIIRNTYEYSEPGIIFIDRINTLNNLKYIEEIRCTNPCGEQPLPPNGTCNLGAINLARMVKDPFSSNSELNWDLISRVAKLGVRFLDNVIEATGYPLAAQRDEEFAKRRLGLGVSGLADCLAQLNLRYGSAQAVAKTEKIFQTICLAAYEESMLLAQERGPFPAFDADKFLSSGSFASTMLSSEYHDKIRRTGIRNGVLLTVAPTGTTSILFGNISSGIEPTFAHRVYRKVRQADNSFREYESFGYNYLLYSARTKSSNPTKVEIDQLPAHMVTAADLTVEEHLTMQAAVQRWVDASVSKTINIPEASSFEQFSKVYDLAYALGCKGCTTYRPSKVRGSILSETSGFGSGSSKSELPKREDILRGVTHKVKWPSMSSALYVTINYTSEGRPFEVFFNSKDARSQEWMTALSLMISAILRKGVNDDTGIGFIAAELEAVHSVHDTAWIKVEGVEGVGKAKFFSSLIAYLGFILGRDFQQSLRGPSTMVSANGPKGYERCPQCLAPSLTHQEGCKLCTNCNFTTC